MKDAPTQLDLRENTASSRRHASRSATHAATETIGEAELVKDEAAATESRISNPRIFNLSLSESTEARLEKSLRLGLAGLRIRRFDPIAEASELPDHSRSAPLLRLFGDRGAPFFVTNSLVQDQPDQSTLSMGDGSDSLIVSQPRDRAAIHDLEDASFGPGCGVSSLIE